MIITARRIILGRLCHHFRNTGQRIITTNGCFDILHVGHTELLRHAANLGDVLIVAVNTDESVSRLKGEGRPLIPLTWRMLLLNTLPWVDILAPFHEDTPNEILEIIRPDIHVKGGDYTEKPMPETEVVKKYGGRVEFIPFKYEISTSQLMRSSGERH